MEKGTMNKELQECKRPVRRRSTKDVFQSGKEQEKFFLMPEQCLETVWRLGKTRLHKNNSKETIKQIHFWQAEHQERLSKSIRKARKQQQKSKQRNESRSKRNDCTNSKERASYDLGTLRKQIWINDWLLDVLKIWLEQQYALYL